VTDHERITIAICAPYFQLLDDKVELQGHCQWPAARQRPLAGVGRCRTGVACRHRQIVPSEAGIAPPTAITYIVVPCQFILNRMSPLPVSLKSRPITKGRIRKLLLHPLHGRVLRPQWLAFSISTST
jgi:hypothetical protein